MDGLDVYEKETSTLNLVFDRYIESKYELRNTTRVNYKYMYDRYVRDGFGKRKIADIKYSDVKFFYNSLLGGQNGSKIQLNTLDTIHTLLHPTFEMAVRDDIIRKNPSNGVIADIKKQSGKSKSVKHALSLEEQRAFMRYIKGSETYQHWVPLFTVMLGTGCRIGEIIGLRWQDLDLENHRRQLTGSPKMLAFLGKRRRRGAVGTRERLLRTSD